MTDQQHPTITPPRELVQEWIAEIWHEGTPVQVAQSDMHLATRSVQWGYEQRGEVNEAKLQQARDQELEACCEWLDRIAYRQSLHIRGSHLRAARRPNPSTLAEKALEQYDRCVSILEEKGYSPAGCIRAALERLKQLEGSND